MRPTLLVMILSLAIVIPGAASAQDELQACRNLGIESFMQNLLGLRGSTVTTEGLNNFCDEYGGLIESVKSLEARLEDVTERLPPKDSILIVDDESGCPSGWTDMAQDDPAAFASRIPLAAIQSEDTDNSFRYRQTGGRAEFTLDEKHMPPHVHGLGLLGITDVTLRDAGANNRTIDIVWYQDGATAYKEGFEDTPERIMSRSGGEKVGDVGNERENVAFNNMPPYVALFFCKQER